MTAEEELIRTHRERMAKMDEAAVSSVSQLAHMNNRMIIFNGVVGLERKRAAFKAVFPDATPAEDLLQSTIVDMAAVDPAEGTNG